MTDPTRTGEKGAEASGVSTITGAAVLGALLIAGAIAFATLRSGSGEDAAQDTPASATTDRTASATPGSSTAPAAGSTSETPGAPPQVDTVAAPDGGADPQTPPPTGPRFDLVRVDPSGGAIIAGLAAPGAEVTLTLDGSPIETVAADATGEFAAILFLTPSDQPRILGLRAVLPDGLDLTSAETVIIAPIAAAAPPDPPPATRTDPPGVAEATSPPAVLDGGAGDAQPAQGEASELAAAPPDPPPATRADPPGVGEATSLPPVLDGGAGDALPAQGEASELAAAAPETGPTPETTSPVEPATSQAPDPVAAPVVAAAPPVAGADPAPQAPAAAPQAPAVLLADGDGVRVLQGPGGAPEALTELRLDAITYDVEGAVTLAGRAPATGSVRATLNNQPINLGEVGPGGQWSLDLPDVDPGTYTLRLEQLASDGSVTGRIETPFLREDPDRIRRNPMLVDPGASVITVQRGFTLWGIAEANFGDGIRYVQIFEENRDQIRDPDMIFPGQIFALPDLPRAAE